jgi:hypothetical protein
MRGLGGLDRPERHVDGRDMGPPVASRKQVDAADHA